MRVGLSVLADGVEKVIETGSFGWRVQCRETSTTGGTVTVQVMQKNKAHIAKAEADTLTRIQNMDRQHQSLCVRMLEHSAWKGHRCLVLEGLGISLKSFMKKYFRTNRDCRHGFALLHVSVFTRQLLQAVAFMHDAKLVNMDLKPGNIYLTDVSSRVITDPNGYTSPRDMHVKGNLVHQLADWLFAVVSLCLRWGMHSLVMVSYVSRACRNASVRKYFLTLRDGSQINDASQQSLAPHIYRVEYLGQILTDT